MKQIELDASNIAATLVDSGDTPEAESVTFQLRPRDEVDIKQVTKITEALRTPTL